MKNRKNIRKLAISMQSPLERSAKGDAGSPYLSVRWKERSEAIKKRVKRRIARVKIRKMEREEALLKGEKVLYEKGKIYKN